MVPLIALKSSVCNGAESFNRDMALYKPLE